MVDRGTSPNPSGPCWIKIIHSCPLLCEFAIFLVGVSRVHFLIPRVWRLATFSDYYCYVTDSPKFSHVKQKPFYYVHGFRVPGICLERGGDGLSLVHDV